MTTDRKTQTRVRIFGATNTGYTWKVYVKRGWFWRLYDWNGDCRSLNTAIDQSKIVLQTVLIAESAVRG